MPQYVLLMSWTDAGVQTRIRQSAEDKSGQEMIDVDERLRRRLLPFNGGVTSFVWTLGAYDMVATVEADSDIAVAGVVLWLAVSEGVRTTTMRAYGSEEIGIGATPASSTVAGVLYRCHADQVEEDGGGGDGA